MCFLPIYHACKKLADLHVNYESANEFPLQPRENKARQTQLEYFTTHFGSPSPDEEI